MTMHKPLRPFFSYFGAKWTLAKHYPVPEFSTIVEPYAGSACYSLHYYRANVVLCEAYGPVADLWEYLIREATYNKVMALPDLGEKSVDDFGFSPGERALIGFWCNSATASPRKRMSLWARAAKTQLFWGPRVRQRVAEQLPAIKHWTILRGRYEDVCPVGRHTYFIDPPYKIAGKAYGVSDVDYTSLAEDCRGLRDVGAQVIVCEAKGADWLPFRDFREVKAMTRTGNRTSKEVVWP